mmetsp:Transcript_49737/g.88935  ORF Transcript_49737/g.88935 Transcript_49737/m.88935 type:complete len:82 (+) Transcript_49737:197-442(+)
MPRWNNRCSKRSQRTRAYLCHPKRKTEKAMRFRGHRLGRMELSPCPMAFKRDKSAALCTRSPTALLVATAQRLSVPVTPTL